MNKDFTIIDKCLLIIGKRHSGKSNLTHHLLSYYSKNFHKVYVASGTERVNKFYTKSGLIPQECIYESYSEEWGQSLIDGLERENSGLDRNSQKTVLLILDDLITTTNFHSSKTIEYFFTCSRHAALSVIVISQHINKVSPTIRDNSDYILVAQQNAESVKLLSSIYRSGKITSKEYTTLYEDSTENYHFFVINCNSIKNKNNINELYGKIKAPVPSYKIVQEVIEKKKIVMKDDDSWGALFSEKKIRTTEIEKITIEKKVLVVVKPYIQNVV